MSFFSIISSVARVAGPLLTKLGNLSQEEGNLSKIPYEQLGEVAFSCGSDGKISAGLATRTSSEVALNYSLTDDAGAVTTVTQPIDSLSGYDATEDMRDFCNGHVVVNPLPSAENLSIPPLRILTYFVPVYFALGQVKISAVFLQWDKKSASFEVSGTVSDFDVEISFADKDGVSFAVSGKSSSKSSLGMEDQTGISSCCSLTVPAGCNTSLPFSNLSVKISVSQHNYEGITNERRSKLKPLSEFPHLQSVLNTIQEKNSV